MERQNNELLNGSDNERRPRVDQVQNEVVRFVQVVFEPNDWVEIRRLPSGRSSWYQAADLPNHVEELLQDNANGENIYVGLNPRKHEGGRTASDVALGRVLLADFDSTTPDDALTKWRRMDLPDPTMVISSGHGAHIYVRLAEPLLDLDVWTSLQKQVIAVVGSDPAIHDPPRVIRLPGFDNLKDPKQPVQCRIASADESQRYETDKLTSVLSKWRGNDCKAESIRTVWPPMVSPPGAIENCLAAMLRLEVRGHENDGSERLIKCACHCVAYRLSESDAIKVVMQYQEMKPFPKPYTESDIRRRLDDAEKNATGESVDAQTRKDKANLMDLARSVMAELFTHNGDPTLRWWRDQFYHWKGTKYVAAVDSELEAKVLSWLDSQNQNARPAMAANILDCLKAIGRVEFSIEQPAYLKNTDEQASDEIIAFSNGLASITDIANELTVKRHTPNWFSTIALDYPYDSDAACPTWLAFLGNIFEGNAECIDLLQRWFGYMLTSDTSYQKLLLMVGPPRAGKGVIQKTMQNVFGGANCTTPTLSSLGTQFGLWPLLGKSIAIFPDAHLGRKADSIQVLEAIKSIVGEDPQNVNRKNLPILLNVKLKVRLVITCNELIHLADTSGALQARLLLLPFNRSFVGSEDRSLEGKLLGEASGILNWAVEGLRRLKKEDGFKVPACAQDMLDNYRRQSAPIVAFLEDACELDPSGITPCRLLYTAWRGWAALNGHEAGANSTFGERLRAAAVGMSHSRRVEGEGRIPIYKGVRLNNHGIHLAQLAEAKE